MTDVELYKEYQDWREGPIWYCVKTTYHNNGKVESDFVKDEKTKVALTVQGIEKPLDGTYQTANATIYYTYHRTYEEAENVIKEMRAIGN